MPSLSEKQQRFLARRRSIVRFWPAAVGLAAGVVVALIVLATVGSRLLFNPYYVLDQLKANAIDRRTLMLMAGMLPIMSCVCLFMVFAFAVVGAVLLYREKMYLEIIDRLQDGT